MPAKDSFTRDLVVSLLCTVLSIPILHYGTRWVAARLSTPEQDRLKASRLKGERLCNRLGLAHLRLTEHEAIIASELTLPEEVGVSFASIGGLSEITEALHYSCIYPLLHPELYGDNPHLAGAPKGVLLYGPPGCGKTMIAKAMAKESGAVFINLNISTLTEKWFGESQKLVRALFTLAQKCQPTIIFIDEIDALLRERSRTDNEANAMIKSEFMSLWDGFGSAGDRILVLGATNRPHDIDAAILRRMPKRFEIKLPDHEQRVQILRLILAKSNVDPDLDFEELGNLTAGCSGSDLLEHCRTAGQVAINELVKQRLRPSSEGTSSTTPTEAPATARPIRQSDFSFLYDGLD